MSSAISTDGASAAKSAAFRPWHFFTVGALLAATAAVLLSQRTMPEHLVMVSVTIFAAAAAAYACYRMVAPLVTRDAAMAESLGAVGRRTIEREKTLVLRTIKELEFDRAMGKVAEEDFAEMSTRLRQRALRLMRQLDDARAASQTRVERELAARIANEFGHTRAAARRQCGSCDTTNDVDARFCKSCGTALSA